MRSLIKPQSLALCFRCVLLLHLPDGDTLFCNFNSLKVTRVIYSILSTRYENFKERYVVIKDCEDGFYWIVDNAKMTCDKEYIK